MTEDNPAATEHHLVAERRRKLEALRATGFRFPNQLRRTALAGQILSTYEGHGNEALETEAVEVAVGGRMMAKRVMGKTSFVKIQDRSGQIQVCLQQGTLPEAVYKAFKGWDVGDILWARGQLFRTKTGEITVRATQVELLVKALRPLPEKFHGLTDQETRYRQRYLDLIMNEDSREVFRRRSQIVQFLRSYLDAMEFLEVETPMMQSIPGGAMARPFVTHHNALDRQLYLRIAPELYLKRLVVGGFERVYELNRNFRNEGISTQHNPEFTMLELYMAYADYRVLMDMVEQLLRSLAEFLSGSASVGYQGRTYDFSAAFRRVSIEDLVAEHNPGLDRRQLRDPVALRAWCERLGISVQPGFGAGKLLTEIFEKTAEHRLEAPTFVTGFPAEVSPLARRSDADPFLTDRFELFIHGREIANGFSELNDAEDQAERFREQASQKTGGDEEAMFYDADYVAALEYGLPPTAGLGIGIDRLVMLLTDSASIRDVLLFPHLRESQGTGPGPG
ncbi:MAG: lysine--tRNA ligase [Gammaproteobacteria bacterium PRO8]|nr:lysine--tRNA ligase [Gammaproteobacteria bacterium PRO8]